MATLVEIAGLTNDPTLSSRCMSAGLIAAQAIQGEADTTANHPNRIKWAKSMFSDPAGWGTRLLRAVLAANSTATVAQINGASDATIQGSVSSCINTFADGT